MVGLVVEEMVERGRQFLLDVGRPYESAIADGSGQIGLAQRADIDADGFVLRAAALPQAGKVVIQDGIETGRYLALAGEALHPDAVADQEMVKGAVQRLEVDTPVGA